MARVLIGSLDFKTKTAAKDFFRAIRDRYEDGAVLSDEDSACLHALISCHPEASDKIGCGIARFTISTEPIFRSRHFKLIRKDGVDTDFSFHSCIDGRNLRRDRLEALRREVDYQIIGFRDSEFRKGLVRCPFLDVPLSPSDCHVDHVPPSSFMRLAEEWLRAEGIRLEDLHITSPGDNQIVTRLTDEKQQKSWAEYHQKNAKLRILSPLGNLSHAKKK